MAKLSREKIIKDDTMDDKLFVDRNSSQESLSVGLVNDEDSSNADTSSDEVSDDQGIESEFKSPVAAILKAFDKPYDPLLEPSPKFPVYHPSFAKAEILCEELMAKGVKLLEASSYQDSSVKELQQAFERCRKVKYPEAKRVGIVGDSGVGKSSLINALLDTEGLAACVSMPDVKIHDRIC